MWIKLLCTFGLNLTSLSHNSTTGSDQASNLSLMSLHTNGSFCISTRVLEIVECSNSSLRNHENCKGRMHILPNKSPTLMCLAKEKLTKKKKKRAKVWAWCALLCEWAQAYLLCRTNCARMGNDTRSPSVFFYTDYGTKTQIHCTALNKAKLLASQCWRWAELQGRGIMSYYVLCCRCVFVTHNY